jgi:hypothetical protein
MKADAPPPPCTVTEGVRSECVKSSMMISSAPAISAVTPTRLTSDITLLSRRLTAVVSTSSAMPSTAALAAPSEETGEVSVPISWKPDHTGGSTTCSASAAADTTTICPSTMIQPAYQPKTALLSRLDHW